MGRRTKEIAGRLAPGAIVVIDHPDLDAVAARTLVRARPVAVINCQPSITGRYPNRGPSVLIEAGVPVFDLCADVSSSVVDGGAAARAPDLFTLLRDGEPVVIRNDALLRTGVAPGEQAQIAWLTPLSSGRIAEQLEAARANLDGELLAFAHNTLEYLQRDEERALLLDPVAALPDVQTVIAGRPVLVAVRGESYEADLDRLGRYLREQRPVVIAVDGAADTLLEAGVRPDIILGDMDSVSDHALRSGAELVVHAYARGSGGGAPGLERLRALGLDASAHTFPVPGTSEDAALLLAYEKGADLIVAVGTHTNLEDFLDKGRRGMASTFLVRLKVGNRLVDARGVSRLYARGERLAPLLGFLTLAALFPVGVLLASTAPGRAAWDTIVLWFRLLFHR